MSVSKNIPPLAPEIQAQAPSNVAPIHVFRSDAIDDVPPNPEPEPGPKHQQKPAPKAKANGVHPPEDEAPRKTISESSGPFDTPEPPPGKPKGLTLESLAEATTAGNAIPLINPTSTAVIIEIRKPEKGEPFMAHPSDKYTRIGYTLKVREEGGGIGETIWLLAPHIAELIPKQIQTTRFHLCFSAAKRRVFIWPITMLSGGKKNSWITSAMRIWGASRERWVCSISFGGAYELHEPSVPIKGKPVWPDKTFAELMLIAFRDLYIDDPAQEEIAKRLTIFIPDPDLE